MHSLQDIIVPGQQGENKMRWHSLASCLWFCSLWNHIETVEHLHSTYGYFGSPGYPSEYGNNLHKEWRIQVREGYRVKIRFTAFDVEDSYDEDRSGACAYDYVRVFDDHRTIGKFCGNYTYYPWDAPRPRRWYYSRGNAMRVEFVSDFSNTGITPYGFQAHYVEVDIDECVEKRRRLVYAEDWDKMLICNHFCNNVPGTYYCDCRNGFTLHPNNHTCVATFCENQILTGDSGVIQSPDYPKAYAKLSQCSWDIRVRDGLTILIQFDETFEIEEHPEAGCVYDSLKLTYGHNSSVHCGSHPPNDGSIIDLGGRNLKVEFKTDLAIERRGFRMTYNTSRIKCREEILPLSHGQVRGHSSNDSNEFEDEIAFACDRGYELKGSARLFCRSDGTWDNPQPTCQIKSCGKPDALLALPNSHIVAYGNATKTYLEVLTVQCNEWYELTEGHPKWRCEDNKEWVPHKDTALHRLLPVCSPVCGIKNRVPLLGGYLSGGNEAEANEWPWVVFINFGAEADLGKISDVCGGSLINSRYVLTATHCLRHNNVQRDAQEVHVWLGAHNRENATGVKYVRADMLITHPQYSIEAKYDYDVALIRLAETIIMNEHYRPVCLPSTASEYQLASSNTASTMWITGWGVSSPTSLPQNTLHDLRVKIPTRDECWKAFQDYVKQTNRGAMPEDVSFTNNMFCAGHAHTQATACEGDSGSPLVTMRNGTQYVQLGLVSFGVADGCSHIKYSVYSRLTEEIVEWMHNDMNSEQQD